MPKLDDRKELLAVEQAGAFASSATETVTGWRREETSANLIEIEDEVLHIDHTLTETVPRPYLPEMFDAVTTSTATNWLCDALGETNGRSSAKLRRKTRTTTQPNKGEPPDVLVPSHPSTRRP